MPTNISLRALYLDTMNGMRNHIVRGLVAGAGWGAFLCLLEVVSGYRLWGPLPGSASGLVVLHMMLVVGTILATVVGIVVCFVWIIVASMQGEVPERLLALAAAIMGLVLVSILLWQPLGRWRQQLLRADLARLDSVISAISRYESNVGVAPDSLRALVPNYLPELPRIRSAALVKLRYERRTDPAGGWAELEYDLGHGRSTVLNLWLNGSDSVVDARCQYLPDSGRDREFESRLWRLDPRVRVSMARSAAARVVGMIGRARLDSLLGAPAYIRGFNPRWSLVLRRDTWGLDPEYYVFTPDGRVPPEARWGTLSQTVGRWRHYTSSD